MPKRSVRKKLKKLSKGTLVEWKKASEKLKWSHIGKAGEPNQSLKTGDLGIILQAQRTPYTWSEVKFLVYWQRTTRQRWMRMSDLHVAKKEKK